MELSGIKGKVALITVANSGIGTAIALKLAEGGAKVAIHFHPGSKHRGRILHAVSDVSETERVLSQVRDIGAEGMSVGADLLDRDSPGAVVRHAVVHAAFGSAKIVRKTGGARNL